MLGDNFSIAYRILNSQFWGVPQSRRRIFLVADFGGLAAPKILFEQESLFEHIAPSGSVMQKTSIGANKCIGDTSRSGICSDRQGNSISIDSYCIAGNKIGRITNWGGNSIGIQPNISYTLTTRDRHAVCTLQKNCSTIQHTQEIRYLTPLECERLMGFPDNWTAIEESTDNARYKALGNSVAIPCVEFVLRGIALFYAGAWGEI